MKKVASVIDQLDADIVNLNEVEDCNVLSDLLDMLPEGHGYRFYLIPGEDNATGQNPGILTRIDPLLDLKHSRVRVDFPIEGSRCQSSQLGMTGCTKHYVTRFRVQNTQGAETTFVLAGLHLLAKPTDNERCARREAQATVVNYLIDRYRIQGDKLILTGDFNDFDNLTPGTDGQHSITDVLEILRGTNSLFNAADLVPQEDRYSCWFDKDQNCIDNGASEHTLIDHMLLSKDWHVAGAAFYHGYKVSCRDRVSDHWPFRVALDLS